MGLLYDNSATAFICLTVLLGGGAAWMTGRAQASTWRPLWLALAYMVLLALAVRFFHFALAHGTLLAPWYYSVDLAVLAVITTLAYGYTRASRMVSQYPWLYKRTSPLTWAKI